MAGAQASLSITENQIQRIGERRRVAQATLDELLTEVGEGLLTDDELRGLQASLPKLAELANEMGCTAKPVTQWSRQEMMRFLAIAVRAAVPLRVASFTLATE